MTNSTDLNKTSTNVVGELDELMPAFTEMYKQWCRLKGYSLGKSPIVILVDEATGAEAARMKEFAEWLRLEVFSRISPNPRKETLNND